MELDLWSSPEHVLGSLVRGLVVYAAALAAVRLAGRRTLSQLSAFDAVVTIAIGSIAASTALPARASVADGTAVLLAFVFAQVSIGWVRQQWPVLQRLTDFAPEVVVEDGEMRLQRSLRSSQMTADELRAKLRAAGVGDIDRVVAAVMESTGSFSVTMEPAPLFRREQAEQHDDAER